MPNDLPQAAAPENDADDKPNAYVGPAGKRESTPWNSRQRQNDFGSLYNSTPEPAYTPPENRSVPAREATGGAGRLAVVLGITAAVVALIAAGVSKLRKPDATPTATKTEVAPLTQPPAPTKAKPTPKAVEARVATPRPAPIHEKPARREESDEPARPRHSEAPKTIVKTVFVPAPAPKAVVSTPKPAPPKPVAVEHVEHTAPKQSSPPKESVEDRAKRLLEGGGE